MRRGALACLLVLFPFFISARQGPDYDLLIRHGKIVDGTANPWYYADVAVVGGKIVAMDKVLPGSAKREIDARGLVVAPGFIDIHSHSDLNLLEDGRAQSKIRQGVTTECLGESSSMGPYQGPLTPPAVKVDLEQLQRAGMPPPLPRPANGQQQKAFTIQLLDGQNHVTYRWVEFGSGQLQQLGLHEDAAKEPNRFPACKYLAERRNKPVQIPLADETPDSQVLHGALFFSRECRNQNIPENDRKRKKLEYFLLARNPEIDPATGRETPLLDSSCVLNADVGVDSGVVISLKPNGGDLMRSLTRKNHFRTADGRLSWRHLGLIVDGHLMLASTIYTEIGANFMMSGQPNSRDAVQLAGILMGGVLPMTLLPTPAKIVEVAPEKTE